MKKLIVALVLMTGCAARMTVRDDGSNPSVPRGGVLEYDPNFAAARQDALKQAGEYCPTGFRIEAETAIYHGRIQHTQMRFVCKGA